MSARTLRPGRRAGAARRRSRRCSAARRLGVDRDLLHQRARRGRDRRRALRLRRELGRALVRPHQLRRRRRLGGRRPLRPRRREAGDHAQTCSRSCATTRSGTSPRSLIAAASAAPTRSLVGLPLMRLSGLAAGIATFGVLEITHNVLRYYEKIGPGSNTFSSVPETTDLLQASIGALLVIGVAFALPVAAASGACCAPRARTSRRPGRRRLRLSPAADRIRALGSARRASPAASTSTCCRSTRRRSTSTSRSSRSRCS